MKIIFEKEKVEEDTPGIIVISHGLLAPALLSSAEMIIGEQKNMAAFAFEQGDEPEAFIAAVTDSIEVYPKGAIVLVDIFGGTPCNQLAYHMMSSGKAISALAGVNLPMLVEAASLRDEMSGEELIKELKAIGEAGIINLNDKLKH